MGDKVLLSTDIGSDVDDAFSLLVQMNAGIDLKGIYVTNGDVKSRAFIAKHMVDLAGKEIDVAVSESKPIKAEVPPYSYYEDAYIDDKFIDQEKTDENYDITYKSLKKARIISKGMKDLADKLSEGKYVVFSIAPMTNIARLIEKYPEAVKNIEQLYVMGCRFEENTLEHNVRFDITAAQEVFESDIPITVIPGDLCSKYKMPAEQLKQLKSDVGLYVKRMAKSLMGIKTAQKMTDNLQRIDNLQIKGFQKNLYTLIENMSPGKAPKIKQSMTKQEKEAFSRTKHNLVVNLGDTYQAAFSPNEYFEKYNGLIKHLRDPEWEYEDGDMIAKELENIIPKSISIADVYIPYCFLNPDKIKTEKTTVKIEFDGTSYKIPGNKHTIVTDIDWDHYKEFLKEYVR